MISPKNPNEQFLPLANAEVTTLSPRNARALERIFGQQKVLKDIGANPDRETLEHVNLTYRFAAAVIKMTLVDHINGFAKDKLQSILFDLAKIYLHRDPEVIDPFL